MNEPIPDALELLRECGALLEGHFLLSSGRHSDKYFQCARLFQYPARAEAILSPVAARLRAAGCAADAVAGPALGGVIPAYELGRLLNLPAMFTERGESGRMTLRRGFDIQEGQCILICEDVVTTGKSSLECAAALEERGAKVCALVCVVDRRERGVPALPWPLYAACMTDAAAWDAADCPLCRRGLPAVKPGSRKTA